MMMAAMMLALDASAVAAETPAANRSSRISGSRKRRAIAASNDVLRGGASVFGPRVASRPAASLAASPCAVDVSSANAASSGCVQKGSEAFDALGELSTRVPLCPEAICGGASRDQQDA